MTSQKEIQCNVSEKAVTEFTANTLRYLVRHLVVDMIETADFDTLIEVFKAANRGTPITLEDGKARVTWPNGYPQFFR